MSKASSSIVAIMLVLGTAVPIAHAAAIQKPLFTRDTIIVGNYQVSANSFAANDAGSQTTYMPVWYVMHGLIANGYTATWDGVAGKLEIGIPTGVDTDLSKITAGLGTAGIYLDGTLVQRVTPKIARDPASGISTSYLPIWYVQQILNRVNMTSTWANRVWTLAAGPKYPLVLTANQTYGTVNSQTEVDKNVLVIGNGTHLQNVKVNGNVYLNPGADGSAYLTNVTVTGSIIVESGAMASIHLDNVTAPVLEVSSSSPVHIVAEGTTLIHQTTITSGDLQSVNLDQQGGTLGNVSVDAKPMITLTGLTPFSNVTVNGGGAIGISGKTQVTNLTVDSSNTTVSIDSGSSVNNLTLNSGQGLAVTNNGTVGTLSNNTSGAVSLSGTGAIFGTSGPTVVTAGGQPVVITDHFPPSVPVITTTTRLVNTATIAIIGTAEAGSTVNITGGLAPASGVADSNGAYNIQVSLTPNAVNTLSVRATDAANNVSNAATVAITEDDTPPSQPGVTNTLASYINLANRNAYVVSGTAEPGSIVNVTLSEGGATLTGSTAAAESTGAYSVTIDTTDAAHSGANALADGTVAISVTATDTEGNVSGASTLNVAKDTAPPGTPSITTAAQSVNTGTIAITGTATAGATVNITGGQAAASGAADSNGNYSIPVTLTANAKNTLSVTATDAANNTSTAATVDITQDSIAPTAPGITNTTTSYINSANKLAYVVSGSAEAGTTVNVTITDGVKTLSKTTTAASTGGAYSVSFDTTDVANTGTNALADGALTIRVTATDTAGNVSTPSSLTVQKDTAAPSASTSVAVTPVSGTVDANTLNTTNTNLLASATIIAGDASGGKAELYVGGTKVATSGAIAAGDTSVTFNLGTASASALQAAVTTGGQVTVKLYDAAGNSSVSTVGNPTLVVDYTAPVAPGITNNASSYINAANKTAYVVSGHAEAGSTVNVTVSDGSGHTLSGNGVATGGGAYSITFDTTDATNRGANALVDGAVTIRATETDTAGNVGQTATVSVAKDTLSPGVPSITTTAQSVNTSAITIVGTAEAGSTVNITGGFSPASGVADSNGNYLISVTLKTNVTNTLSVTATDAANNTSAAATVNITQDNQAPSIPTITTTAKSVNTSTITIVGTAEAFSTVKITGGQSATSGAADSSGNYSIPVTLTANATNTLSVTATDAASNTSGANTVNITQDSIAPAAPSITNTAMSYINSANESAYVVSGTAEAGSTVYVTLTEGGKTLSKSTTAGSTGGAFTVTFDATDTANANVNAMVDGTVTISATATDKAGNVGQASTVNVTKDTVAPSAPTAVGVSPLGGKVVSNTLNLTNVDMFASATITTGEATGGMAELYVGATKIATSGPIAAGDTSVVFNLGTASAGALQAAVTAGGPVTVKLYDAAGNSSVSTVGNPTLVVDYTPPALPVITNTALTYINSANKTAYVVSGSAEAGSTVNVTLSDGSGHTLSASGVATGGTYSITFDTTDATNSGANALLDGAVTIRATDTDTAGNVGPTATATVTKDTVPPNAPSAVGSVSFQTSASVQYSYGLTPAFTATVDAGTSVTFMIKDLTAGTAATSQSGTISGTMASDTSSTLTDGHQYQVWAVSTDEAGNTSAGTSTTFTADAQPTYTLGTGTSNSATTLSVVVSKPLYMPTGTALAGTTNNVTASFKDSNTGATMTANYDATTKTITFTLTGTTDANTLTYVGTGTTSVTDAAGNPLPSAVGTYSATALAWQ